MGSRECGGRAGAQSPRGAAPQQLCPTQGPQRAACSCEVRSVCDRSWLRLDSKPCARLAPPTPTATLTEPIQQGPGAAQKGARCSLRPQPARRAAPRPFRPLQSSPDQLQTLAGAGPGRGWVGGWRGGIWLLGAGHQSAPLGTQWVLLFLSEKMRNVRFSWNSLCPRLWDFCCLVFVFCGDRSEVI